MERESQKTGEVREKRIEHRPGAITQALRGADKGTRVAIEATGNWYWIVNEIEAAGLVPQLVHPGKAKDRIGNTNKTDRLDVHGLNMLQRTGTLPVVWIPSAEIRDLRELTRARMVCSHHRTTIKNIIHAILAKHGKVVEASDIFGKKARAQMELLIQELPAKTAWVMHYHLNQLDFIQGQIGLHEKELKAVAMVTPEIELVMTMPGIAVVLGTVIAVEIGDVHRFGGAEQLASYCGTTPRVSSSGGKIRIGRLRNDVNHYLKWAFAEAANSVAVNHKKLPNRYGSQLYRRLREKKGHAKAIGAVAHHLSEAAYYVLSRQQGYLERGASSPAAVRPDRS